MTANLVLALLTIAGLGVLALCLIFFGGSKKPKQTKTKLSEEKNSNSDKQSAGQYKEPFISVDIAEVSEVIPSKSSQSAKDKIDPAIASLGFSAIDDLLDEPESTASANKASKTKKTATKLPTELKTAIKKKTAEKDILVLYVMAPVEQPFVGYELLQAMTTAGMRFGKMDIFHCYDDEDPEIILFSLCSAVEPGAFDVANIGALYCPGLSLFMRISAVDNPRAVFNLMLETANQLADDLAGIVCDEKRQPLTDKTLHEYLTLAAKQIAYTNVT